jgi:hypothetical protein
MKGGDIFDVDSVGLNFGFEYEFSIGIFASDGMYNFVSLTKDERIPIQNAGKNYELFGDTTVDPTFIAAEKHILGKYGKTIKILDLEITILATDNNISLKHTCYTSFMSALNCIKSFFVDSNCVHKHDGPLYIIDIETGQQKKVHLFINNNYSKSYDLVKDVTPQLTFDTNFNNIFKVCKQLLLKNDEEDITLAENIGSIFTQQLLNPDNTQLQPLTELHGYIQFLCFVYISTIRNKKWDNDTSYLKSYMTFAIRHSVNNVLSVILHYISLSVGIPTKPDALTYFKRMIKLIVKNIYNELNDSPNDDPDDNILNTIFSKNYTKQTSITELPINPDGMLKIEYRFYSSDAGFVELLKSKQISDQFIMKLNQDIVDRVALNRVTTNFDNIENDLQFEFLTNKYQNNDDKMQEIIEEYQRNITLIAERNRQIQRFFPPRGGTTNKRTKSNKNKRRTKTNKNKRRTRR